MASSTRQKTKSLQRAAWWRRYRDYINSPRWQSKRREALRAAGYRCQECGIIQSGGLHVHHLTYLRLGDEDLADLQVLCERCHRRRHPTKARKRRSNHPYSSKPK